jgi:hypothetical protein
MGTVGELRKRRSAASLSGKLLRKTDRLTALRARKTSLAADKLESEPRRGRIGTYTYPAWMRGQRGSLASQPNFTSTSDAAPMQPPRTLRPIMKPNVDLRTGSSRVRHIDPRQSPCQHMVRQNPCIVRRAPKTGASSSSSSDRPLLTSRAPTTYRVPIVFGAALALSTAPAD